MKTKTLCWVVVAMIAGCDGKTRVTLTDATAGGATADPTTDSMPSASDARTSSTTPDAGGGVTTPPTGPRVFTNGQNATLVLGQSSFTTYSAGSGVNGLHNPSGVAIDPTSGKIFVADNQHNRVLRFSSMASLTNGANAEVVLGQPDFVTNSSAAGTAKMFLPRGLAVDSAGRLWVADTTNHRVLRFDSASSKVSGASADGVLGQVDFTGALNATQQNRMAQPWNVAIDSAGRLWVTDTANHRVLRFDNAASKANGANADGVLGQAVFTSSAPATTQSGMNYPFGLALDAAGRLWVAEGENHRVLRFDGAAAKANGASADGVLGQANFTVNVAATTRAGMNDPRDVVVDAYGRLWVADTFNRRVLRFDGAATRANGADADGVLGQSGFLSNAAAVTQSGFGSPEALAADALGNIWVADYANHRVLYFAGQAP